jgi:hypothetical protein
MRLQVLSSLAQTGHPDFSDGHHSEYIIFISRYMGTLLTERLSICASTYDPEIMLATNITIPKKP